MSVLTIILTVLQLISGLAVTVVVLMQSGKSAGLSGAISGGAETFLSKGKAKTWDAKLAKATKWFALAFVLLTLLLNLILCNIIIKLPGRMTGQFLYKEAAAKKRLLFIPMSSKRPGSSRRWPACRCGQWVF